MCISARIPFRRLEAENAAQFAQRLNSAASPKHGPARLKACCGVMWQEVNRELAQRLP
jgi:hypothetical protein